MRELLNANNPDDVPMHGSGTFDFRKSPFSDTGNYSTMSPYNPMTRSSASFTPRTSSSPVVKKSKLSISTSNGKLIQNMSRSVSGIALRTQSPQKQHHHTPHTSSAAHMAFPNFDSCMNQSRLLGSSRSGYLSTSNTVGELFAGTSNVDPSEAKSLYFAHYNGLEVWHGDNT